ENALGQLHTCRSDAHRTRAKLGFRANPLANFQRALKQAVQDGAGNVRGVSTKIRFADLAEDFRFSKEHGFQSGRNAKEMAHRIVIVVVIQGSSENFWLDRMKCAEKTGKRGGGSTPGGGVDAVNLAAIA